MKRILWTLFLLPLACGPTEFNTVQAERYSMDIADYMSSTTDLNQEASLQYQSPVREVYVAVIDESKAELQALNLFFSLPAYSDLASQNFGTLPEHTIEKQENAQINGLNAIVTDFSATLPENNAGVFYRLAVVESPTHFYQITGWTLKERRDLYYDDLTRMIQSFREGTAETVAEE